MLTSRGGTKVQTTDVRRRRWTSGTWTGDLDRHPASSTLRLLPLRRLGALLLASPAAATVRRLAASTAAARLVVAGGARPAARAARPRSRRPRPRAHLSARARVARIRLSIIQHATTVVLHVPTLRLILTVNRFCVTVFVTMGGQLRWALCLSGNPPLCVLMLSVLQLYCCIVENKPSLPLSLQHFFSSRVCEKIRSSRGILLELSGHYSYKVSSSFGSLLKRRKVWTGCALVLEQRSRSQASYIKTRLSMIRNTRMSFFMD